MKDSVLSSGTSGIMFGGSNIANYGLTSTKGGENSNVQGMTRTFLKDGRKHGSVRAHLSPRRPHDEKIAAKLEDSKEKLNNAGDKLMQEDGFQLKYDCSPVKGNDGSL